MLPPLRQLNRFVPRHGGLGVFPILSVVICLGLGFASSTAQSPPDFKKDIQPVLVKYCYDCHGDGMSKGKVTFDDFKTEEELFQKHDLWLAVLKNVRAGVMPPDDKARPTIDEIHLLEKWIKKASFKIDSANPDPGRVTVRRLNRAEYRNTVKELLGVDFDTEGEFPPDDTGHGFDNIGDVLTLSPMLLEKYLDASKKVVLKVVPLVSAVAAEKMVHGSRFSGEDTDRQNKPGSLSLSYYKQASISNTFKVDLAGDYVAVLDFVAAEKFVDDVFDYNKCRLVFKIDGEEVLNKEYVREGNKSFQLVFPRSWEPGEHHFEVQIEPLTPDEKQVRSLAIKLNGVNVRGPMEKSRWVPPANYHTFFPRKVPADVRQKRAYAHGLLSAFATKAFRRPVDRESAERLSLLAEQTYSQPGKTFESGVAQGMIAILASPRFLFREESAEKPGDGSTYAFLDQYSLASRLSYFLWSSMPDERLFQLAASGKLRENQADEVQRMLKDPKSQAFIRNFSGQWLQSRDVDSVQIDSSAVLARETARSAAANPRENRGTNSNRPVGFGRNRVQLDDELRRAMKSETESYFGYIVQSNRNVLELIDSDYTFLNERLARHYALTNLGVTGSDFRKVTLPEGNPRGGILTHGSVLTVTSNPTRTSPVKRGLFILENILGTPPPPPPPDIPALEEASKGTADRIPSLRETLELHRSKPVCSSCHNRMDPLGLALENFNALGMWREKEQEQPIDASGKLMTGETFTDIRDVKKILTREHSREIYHTLSEKLLTYALGRGLEYYDVDVVDDLVRRLEKENGAFSAALMGVIESTPFQKTRLETNESKKTSVKTASNQLNN